MVFMWVSMCVVGGIVSSCSRFVLCVVSCGLFCYVVCTTVLSSLKIVVIHSKTSRCSLWILVLTTVLLLLRKYVRTKNKTSQFHIFSSSNSYLHLSVFKCMWRVDLLIWNDSAYLFEFAIIFCKPPRTWILLIDVTIVETISQSQLILTQIWIWHFNSLTRFLFCDYAALIVVQYIAVLAQWAQTLLAPANAFCVHLIQTPATRHSWHRHFWHSRSWR